MLEVKSCVQCRHDFNKNWSPTVGEYNCAQESNNTRDPYAVVMMQRIVLDLRPEEKSPGIIMSSMCARVLLSSYSI